MLIKEPVKLIKRVKIAHSFLQSVSDQFHVIITRLISLTGPLRGEMTEMQPDWLKFSS